MQQKNNDGESSHNTVKNKIEQRPWSTIFITICLTPFLTFIVQFFTDTPFNTLIVSFILAFTLALYNDYLRPNWRARTRSQIHSVVSTNENATSESRLKKPAETIQVAASFIDSNPVRADNIDDVFPQLEPISRSSYPQLLTATNHRLDRLRQYRFNMRNLVSGMLIALMVIFHVIEFITLASFEVSYFGVVLTLLVLLEYNVSLIARKPVAGIFFRDSSEPTVSPASGLEGEEKIGMLMKRNPFGLGTGILGRPLVGIIFCGVWLLVIDNRVITVSCIVIAILLMARIRRALESADGPFTLLELRVFDTPSYDRFLELLEGWQYIGMQYRLEGPDTTGYSFTNRFKVLLGKVDDLIIKKESELNIALAKTHKSHDKFERFDLTALQCNDATWVKALRESIERCDVVAMLLTDFSAEDRGCAIELKILMDMVPMSNVILLINSKTDLQYLQNTLKEAWKGRAKDSPNIIYTEGPYIFDLDDLYSFKSDNERPGVTIKMQLIDILYSKAKNCWRGGNPH